MGADFCLAMCPLDLDRPAVIERFTDLLDSPDWATRLAETDSVPGVYFTGEPLTDSQIADCWVALEELADLLDTCYGTRWARDIDIRSIDGRDWLFSGGMSWGDAPTDSYSSVCLLAALALTYDEWCHVPRSTS